MEQLTLAPAAPVDVRLVPLGQANDLLTRWGHYLGPTERPFRQEPWVLFVDNAPVSVAVSASTVSSTAAGYDRHEIVELARLCSTSPWATRVMLRLWREVLAPRWDCWPVNAAVAYSKNDRHEGRIYRFDGWERVGSSAGSTGGGTWTKARGAADEAAGAKTLWRWTYAPPTDGWPERPDGTDREPSPQLWGAQ